ncbi:hypothetical protein [Streptomyces buecherae]|uniref:Uncharacterized protein n=1 Tax=Streptomyces buecherae TaxID=2763006 RepID=A0A7H8N1F2_9ACTN|nr:hypothetical protein [Streptomyces buecherae]QKW48179.1 hypothetical protein HUT08_04280 [Streptomyces buecherae]
MGKGSTKSEVKHFQTLKDGRIGCWIWNCGLPATRWIDMERYGIRRWLSTAYCDHHGDSQPESSDHTHRERRIKEEKNK